MLKVDSVDWSCKFGSKAEYDAFVAHITAAKDAEIERLQAYIEGQDDSFATMMEGVKTRNAEIARLTAFVAMQAAALIRVKEDLVANDDTYLTQSTVNILDKARSATAETVSAWQSKRDNEIRAKALEDAALKWLPNMRRTEYESSMGKSVHNMAVDDCIKHVLTMASELRAKGE